MPKDPPPASSSSAPCGSHSLEAVARLAGGIAHDFNNILTVILSASRGLLDELREDDPLRGDAQDIEAAARRAASLTRQLLAISRRQPLEPRVLDVDELLAGVEKTLRRIVGEEVELVLSGDGAAHRVVASEAHLEQVLLNLAVHAHDAMPGGGRLTVDLRAVPAGDPGAAAAAGACVLITVRDTGAGLDPQVLAHLFEPFLATGAPGKDTGLGLSTAYGIVRQIGGEIRVETAPGQGSAFHVLLPAAALSHEPAVQLSMDHRLLGSEETVLVAEDEPQVRALLVRSLRSLGYTVREASNGLEALDLADGIHLLVTDAVMPAMGGGELAERLRATRPDLPVLLVSGHAAGDAPLPHGPGIGVLPKPFTPATLARKLDEVLALRVRPARRRRGTPQAPGLEDGRCASSCSRRPG